MSEWPILSTIIFLPLVGALLVLVIRGDDEIAQRNIFNVAVWTTTVTFILSLFVWINFDSADPGFQMVETWRASRMCSRVWGIGPSAAETTRIAPSIWAAPVIMFFT